MQGLRQLTPYEQSKLKEYEKWISTLNDMQLFKEFGRVCAWLKGEEIEDWETN